MIPGEVGMVFTGAAAERNGTALVFLIAAGSVGAVAGDCVGYAIGRRWGTDVVAKWRWTRRTLLPALDRAQAYYADRGGWSVAAARWVGALRAVVPLVVGSAKMPLGRFLLWDAPSAVLWVTATTTAGYLFGSSVADFVDRLGWTVSAVVVTALVVAYLVYRRRRGEATT